MADENGTPPKQPTDPKRPGGPNVKMSRNIVSWFVLLGLAMLLVAVLSNTFSTTSTRKEQRRTIRSECITNEPGT